MKTIYREIKHKNDPKLSRAEGMNYPAGWERVALDRLQADLDRFTLPLPAQHEPEGTAYHEDPERWDGLG